MHRVEIGPLEAIEVSGTVTSGGPRDIEVDFKLDHRNVINLNLNDI